MKRFIVTYKYRGGIGSADFSDIESALQFARNNYGSRIYEKVDGYYVPYKRSVTNG